MAIGDIVASTVVDGAPAFPCGPCESEPTGCCLFPATGDYPDTDLPDSVIYDGVTFNRTANPWGEQMYDDGDGHFIHWLGDPDFQWQLDLDDGHLNRANCLIGFYTGFEDEIPVEDVFLDDYLVNGLDTISRASPCAWTGAKTGGGTWNLNYGISTPFKFHLSFSGPSPTSDDRDDPQNDPAGTYGLVTVA